MVIPSNIKAEKNYSPALLNHLSINVCQKMTWCSGPLAHVNYIFQFRYSVLKSPHKKLYNVFLLAGPL